LDEALPGLNYPALYGSVVCFDQDGLRKARIRESEAQRRHDTQFVEAFQSDRGVSLEAHEAVALARELLAHPCGIPTPGYIQLDSDGSASCTSTAGVPSVASLAERFGGEPGASTTARDRARAPHSLGGSQDRPAACRSRWRCAGERAGRAR
jgi:hypothetical protein